MFPVGSAAASRPDGRRHRLLDEEGAAHPADKVASSTARFSARDARGAPPRGYAKSGSECTFWMKCRSICSVTSKSAMTPSLSARMALMFQASP